MLCIPYIAIEHLREVIDKELNACCDMVRRTQINDIVALHEKRWAKVELCFDSKPKRCSTVRSEDNPEKSHVLRGT